MASDSVSTQFDATHDSNYNYYGTWGGEGQTYSVGSGGFNENAGNIAYETFDAAAIQAEAAPYVAAGWTVHATLNYELSTTDASSHSVVLNAGYYSRIGYQNEVEADQTDHTGPGNGTAAYVYRDLQGTGETIGYSHTTNFAGVFEGPAETATYSVDISEQIEDASNAGRDLVLTLNEQGSAEDELENTYIELDATKGANPPTIAGTQSDQPVIAGGSDLPFSTVTLGDSANPSGAGDQIEITILDPNSNGTDAYGTLAGAGLTSYGDGQYQLAPASSLSTLQTELDALVFTASPSAAGAHVVFELDLQSSSDSAADDENTSVVILDTCFAAGTLIAIPDGERPVEQIEPGDIVRTADGARAVIWCGHRNVDVSRVAEPDNHWLVCIRADAFEIGRPHRDVWVTQEHAILVDGGLIPARMLVNGGSILLDRSRSRYTYYHLELAQHGILFAEGLPTESYLDTGNRASFGSASVTPMLPDRSLPDPGRWDREAAAPLVTARERVEPIWQRLADRAAAMGRMRGVLTDEASTDDPALRLLLADGTELEPCHRAGGQWSFHIPIGGHAVRLLSRSTRPSDSIGPFVDDRRRLGVAVDKLVLWQGLDDSIIPSAALQLPGWYAVEGDTRWTNGAAMLDLPVARNATTLDVHVVAVLRYALARPTYLSSKAA